MNAQQTRSLLTATDLSEGSDLVVRSAAAQASAADAELHLLHALDLQSGPYSRSDYKQDHLPGPDSRR